MAWSWYEWARDNETDWEDQLDRSEEYPTFLEILDAAKEVTDLSGGRLVITTQDPYTGETYTRDVRIYDTNNSTITGGDGQIRMFVLPDLTVGHFDTQGRAERMPDLVVDYEVKI